MVNDEAISIVLQKAGINKVNKAFILIFMHYIIVFSYYIE